MGRQKITGGGGAPDGNVTTLINAKHIKTSRLGTVPGSNNINWAVLLLLSLDCHARLEYYIIICHISCRGDT